jgi:hypothetical protein
MTCWVRQRDPSFVAIAIDSRMLHGHRWMTLLEDEKKKKKKGIGFGGGNMALPHLGDEDEIDNTGSKRRMTSETTAKACMLL